MMMPSEHVWDAIYREALAAVPGRIASNRGVALAFHTVVDGLHQAQPGELDRLIAGEARWREAAASGLTQPPAELRQPEDVLAGVAWSVAHSTALERVLTDEGTFHWLMEHLPVHRPTVGGNSGNMALALADLGFPRVLVFTPPLHPTLARLLAQAPQIQVLAGEGAVPIAAAPVQAREGALHWIFEYPPGMELHLPGRAVTATRANRFIAAWNPGNHRLAEGTQWLHAFAPHAARFSHLILSGFQLLSETYPDGTTFETWAAPLLAALAAVRQHAPGLLIHYEWASMASPKIRAYLLRELLPQVDSLGLNEAELALMAHDLG
ncbi:MAG TPA: ADP-dependent glucokinase/phosphofructokinase, partial [Limnochorda sp.]